MPAPANNVFANRTVISSLPYSLAGIDDSLCTEEVGAPDFIAQGDGSAGDAQPGFKHLWWEFTPATTQNYLFELSSSSPTFGIFTGTALGALTEVASWWGRLTVRLEAGVPYQFCVISYNGSAMPVFTLTVTATPTRPLQTIQTAEVLDPSSAFPLVREIDASLLTDNAPMGNERGAVFKVTLTEETYLSFWVHKGTAATTIDPWIQVYSDRDWNIFDWPDNWPDFFNYIGVNYPVWMAFPAGTYYFVATHFSASPVAQNIAIDVQQWTQPSSIDAGLILISDDRGFLPAAAIDAATCTLIGFVPGVPSSETWFVDSGSGKTLMHSPFGSGAIGGPLLEMYPYDGDDEGFTLFDADFTKLWHLNETFSSDAPTTGVGNGKFYIANKTPHPGLIGGFYRVNLNRMDVSAPVLEGVSWTPAMENGTSNIFGMAISRDETIIYYTEIDLTGGPIPLLTKVKRWNLTTNTALSDLASSGGSGHKATREILVLEDDSILVSWFKSDLTSYVRRYDPSGATLNTYNLFDATSVEMRMWHDTDPANFWVWVKTAGELSVFRKIRASDGTVLTTCTLPWFESGLLGTEDSVTPIARFGHTFSCGGIVMRAAIGTESPTPSPSPSPEPEVGTPGPYVWVHWPAREVL